MLLIYIITVDIVVLIINMYLLFVLNTLSEHSGKRVLYLVEHENNQAVLKTCFVSLFSPRFFSIAALVITPCMYRQWIRVYHPDTVRKRNIYGIQFSILPVMVVTLIFDVGIEN